MVQNNLVSVIMPAFNSASYIKESIDSVINQTYKEWELLVVDDSSTDQTRNIVESFKDPRVKLLSNRFQKGVVGARNTAIICSQGRYLAFLDSDDLWSFNKLKEQVRFMDSNDYSFTYTFYHSFIFSNQKNLHLNQAPYRLSYSNLLRTCSIGCLTVMIDKNHFSDLVLEQQPKEDYVFWLKLLKQTKYAYALSLPLARYRISSNSLSSNKFHEIINQWHVLRHVEKLSFVQCVFNISSYAYFGLLKRINY
jgi:glycosyltransferase involved in cell wall biosynthesis